MDDKDFREIYTHMNVASAVFRIVLDETRSITAAVIEDCNERYLQYFSKIGMTPDQVIHHSYFEIAPEHDPRWNYYFYQAAVLRRQVHGELRNREFGDWLEFSAGPVQEADSCWMVFVDHSKYKKESERFHRLSQIDLLSRTKNRNAYEAALARYRAAGVPVGVIMVDINGLKQVNDREGHEAGDRLIERLASFLCTESGRDLPYRIGGDEFVLLESRCTREATLAKKARIEAYTGVPFSCGAGWVDDSRLIDKAIEQADAAMYEAKKRYYLTHDRRTEF